jgi:hypothetical protein
MPQDDALPEQDGEPSNRGEPAPEHAFTGYLSMVEERPSADPSERALRGASRSRPRFRHGILSGVGVAGLLVAMAWPGTRELAITFTSILRELDPLALSWGVVGVAACATLVAVWAASTV